MRPQTLIIAIALSASPAFAFDLKSADLENGGEFSVAQVSNAFGCSGGNSSPEISWSNLPSGTKSLVVTMYDPDAPTGSGFWHWVVADIPSSATGLQEGAGNPVAPKLPRGAFHARNDAGITGYLGACPPRGTTHKYVLTVKALKVQTLSLDPSASGALVGFASNAEKLAEETIIVTYGR